MSPYEVMLSESQERMLLVVRPGDVPRVQAVFEKWDVPCRDIGRIIAEREAQVLNGSDPVAHLPIQPLADAPSYRLKGEPSPADLARQELSLDSVPLPPVGPEATLLRLMAAPNIASKESVYRRYDHQVQTNTVVGPGGDAAVLRIKGTEKAIAVCIDGNGRYCQSDPYVGGQIVVAEVCRNLSCSGAKPLALTDCLNFGNPERPDVYYQLEKCIQGMALACQAFEVPVVSGNVSLYNEARGQAVFPTPVVGGLGLLDDATKAVRAGFPEEGLVVALLGPGLDQPTVSDLAGSEYLQTVHGMVAGRPEIDLTLEKGVQDHCRFSIDQRILRSAHDCSDGGLAVALAECCIQGAVGFRGEFEALGRWDTILFGEKQSRIIVTIDQERFESFLALARANGVPAMRLGYTDGDRFRIGSLIDLPISQLTESWRNGLETAGG